MGRFRRALLALALALGPWCKLACVSRLELNDRPCPCAAGYVCCASSQTCLRPTQFCQGSPDENAGAPPLMSQSEAGAAGTTSTPSEGGSGGEPEQPEMAGAGGEPGPPHWRPVGVEGEGLPTPTDSPNIAFAPNGDAYLAYRGCEPCAPLGERTELPVVVKLESAWQRVSGEGMSTVIKSSPVLVAQSDGTLSMLTDQDGLVWHYDGKSWAAAGPALPYRVHLPPQLEQDDSGKLYAAAIDDDTRLLQVMRLDAGGWVELGSGVLAVDDSLRLRVVGSDLYRAYLLNDADSVRAYVDRFNGTDWVPLGDFDSHDVDLAVSPSGDIYLALQNAMLNQATVMRRQGSTWKELNSFSASWRAPLLRVSANEALFVAYLVEDYVNVNRYAGGAWLDLESMTIGHGSTSPALQVAPNGVPYIAFLLGATLSVRKYQ